MALATTASNSPEKQTGDINNKPTGKMSSIMVDDPSVDIHSTNNLKTFVSFICDRRSTEMATCIKSSLELFNYCIPSREAVLAFYSDLFCEYSTYYWIVKKRALSSSSHPPSGVSSASVLAGDQPNKSKIEYVGELTRRFYEMAKLKLADAREDQMSDFGPPIRMRPSPSKSIPSVLTGPESPTTSSQSCSSPTNTPKTIPIGPKVIPVSRRTSSCNSNDMEQTPMSPSAQENEVETTENDVQYESDANAVDIFSELEDLISLIRLTLEKLIKHYELLEHRHLVESKTDHIPTSRGRQRERLRSTLTNWASDLLIQLSSKHSDVANLAANELSKNNPSNLLTKQIDLWLGNPVNNLLVDILLESHHNIQSLFSRLVSSTQNCDWLLAYILLKMSKRPDDYEKDFSTCMEFIMDGSQTTVRSLTYILAYLSDNNPKAMANFPKSNIPFLMSLCQTSNSLLNVLALEIPETINTDFLNKLTGEVWKKSNDNYPQACIESLTHCIIAAPNSYKLFLLAIDVKFGQNLGIDQRAIMAAQVVIESVLVKTNERAIQGMLTQNLQLQLIDGLLDQIRRDPAKLIEKSLKYPFSSQVHRIFHRMGLIFGNLFASKVICHYLNLPEKRFWPLLRPLLREFMKQFGDDGSTLVSQTLSLESNLRTPTYWANMNSLAAKLPQLKLDLDLVSQLLTDKLCAATFDINSTAQLIKLCCNSLERVDHSRICISTKHRLCVSLATCYFLLLEIDNDNFPEILSSIRISLTCMSLLKQSSVASHILCRALLERSLVYGHLFNEDFSPDLIGDGMEANDWTRDDTIKLSRENLKVTLGHRFRRLPNHNVERIKSKKSTRISIKKPDVPDKQSINSYLLIEAFKSSINNIEAFANLFVEFHCPVMFDKNSWPNDDALRVINERNLSILRKFEQVPPLWDLYELIGQARCLKNCLVLVKALLAAHLALWASATTKSCPDKMISTSRLIPPLAQSGLVPKAFGLTVEVFPHLNSSEVFSVLSDIWQYLKDTNTNGTNENSPTPEERKAKAKTYLNRLRLFMCQHMPGPLYVKIFKEFYAPPPKTIPT